jgi:hypothetical protein
MNMAVNELKDRVGQELFVSDWIVVQLERSWPFKRRRC